MRCRKCGRKIDVSEANEYYYDGELIPAKNVDLYPERGVKAVCQRCI